jgi:hypothetical protein
MPLSQRRHYDTEDLQPIGQIGTKLSGADHLLQIRASTTAGLARRAAVRRRFLFPEVADARRGRNARPIATEPNQLERSHQSQNEAIEHRQGKEQQP